MTCEDRDSGHEQTQPPRSEEGIVGFLKQCFLRPASGQKGPTRFPMRRILWLTLVAAIGCGEDSPTGPAGLVEYDILVLNSTGQTLAPFQVAGGSLRASGPVTDLGGGFDGDAVAVSDRYATSSISSFGGSRLAIVDLNSGGVVRAGFPGADPEGVNPSRTSMDAGDTLWVGGRGSDAVYRLNPGAAEADLVASKIGTFIERVVPGEGELYAIDANLDDDGFTWTPLGPGRVIVLDRSGQILDTIELPAVAVNPSDAVLTSGRLIVMAGGTFDPVTFSPNADGALIIIDPAAREVISTIPLQANGVSIKLGLDAAVYLTTTTDFVALHVLRFDPLSGEFLHGPANPIETADVSAKAVDCWTATALADGRLVCITFRSDAPGRLLLLNSDGSGLSEIESGFGSTDVAIRP